MMLIEPNGAGMPSAADLSAAPGGPAAALARKLSALDYFTLAFGTMVGVGWLVVMDDWLERGGPLGGMLGFALGGLALLPIAYVYGRLVRAIPDAGSEIAYTERTFPRFVSFATGWMMTLAYLVVCPWEAVAIGKILAYLFPALDSFELYRLAGKPVYAPHLVLGLSLAAVIALLNYRGIRLAANFQNWTTFGLLALFAAFGSLGVARGSLRNFSPPFSHGGWVSVLLMLQVVPYFMTGFESVPKCAEEARPGFRDFSRAILLAAVVGAAFYTAVIGVVAMVAPWQPLSRMPFATAAAFERAFGGRVVVDLIFAAAILSLLKIFNGNFVAASRLLFSMGRRGWISPAIGRVHPANQTPHVAVLAAGLLTAAATFAGEAILIPVTEVGSMASAAGWLAACAACFRLERVAKARAAALFGSLVALALVLMKFLPWVPGHFTTWEFATVAGWLGVGLAFRLARRGGQASA